MPRSTYSGSYLTTAGSTTAFPDVIDAVEITLVDGVTKYRYATQETGFRLVAPNVYTSRLRRVSNLTLTLNGGFGRVSLGISNSDLALTALLGANGGDYFIGATVQVYKILDETVYIAALQGIVTGYRLDETGLELDVVTKTNRTPTLSNRRVGSKCPWVFKGTECGYVGVETVCNKLYSDAGGCSGRSNQHRFGGFPDRAGVETIGRISGLGAAPAYQLVQLDTTYTEQRTTLRFDDTFTVVDDPGTNATVITAVGGGGADVTPDWIDVKADHDAAGVTTTTTGDITSGTDQLTVLSATSFAQGQGIRIAGAGPATADLITTINSIAGTTFTLADNASTTVDDAVVSHDDTAAIQAAIDAAEAGTVKTVFIPAGTYNVTGLTASGNVTILGSGDKASKLLSTANAVILDCDADASFEMPKVENLRITGDTGAGTSQIGLKFDDGTYGLRGVVRNVWIEKCGSNGLYIGKAFSSLFENVFIDDCEGYPFLYNASDMPGNVFRSIYVGVLRAAAPAGFRIKAGDFVGHNLNGINNALASSKWMVVGRKNGVDGDAVNAGASVRLYDCNIESWVSHGIYLYASSNVSLFNCYFAGDASGNGTKKPIEFEHINDGSDYYAHYIQRGFIADTCTFADGPLTNYANNEAIHCNGFPPLETIGQGPRVASGDPLSTYYNSSTSSTQRLSRIDQNLSKVVVTATTSFANAGVRYIECNHAAGITVSLPWPGHYKLGQIVIVKDISSAGAATSNVTINANGGGSVNGGSFTLNVNGQAVMLAPDGSSDWRVVATYAPGSITGSGSNTRLAYWSSASNLTSSGDLLWDDSSKILTVSKAGGNPYVLITDTSNTIDLRLGTLAGAPDRGIAGTMTNDPFVLYQNGGEAWGLDTSKHFVPFGTSNTRDIGTTSTRARSAYIGTSIDIGVSSATAGEIVLRNASNANTLTIKPGATSAATTLTLPTDDGTSGQFMKTDGAGVLSWDTPAAGANTALSNLASVAVNTSLLPGADNTHDLGSATYSWRDAHIERDALLGRQIQSSGSALSASAGTGAGTGPTITIDGNAIAGAILLTTGSGPATSAQIVQMTMTASFTTYPVVIITPGNAAAAALSGNKQVFVDDAAMLANKWTLKSGSTALDASTDYVWYFHVMGI